MSSSFSTSRTSAPIGASAAQFEQAAVVVAELELARRAQHALALDAAQLAQLDQEGLAVFARRQLGADQRAAAP